jgi:DNA-binding NarL/FixJ family response regulator
MLSLLPHRHGGLVEEQVLAPLLALHRGDEIPDRLIGALGDAPDVPPHRITTYVRAGGTLTSPPSPILSRREREALTLLASGLTCKAAAARMGVSPSSVSTFLVQARERLGADTNEQAVRRMDRIATPTAPDDPRLTPLQHLVLRSAARGLTRAETAEALGRGEETIKSATAEALRRLGVRNVAQAVYVLYSGPRDATSEEGEVR